MELGTVTGASLSGSVEMAIEGRGPEGPGKVELDVELTSDGELIVMHDDTLDRTTTCEGCASAFTLAGIRRCRLLDGDGRPTDEIPPTLSEVYAAMPPDTPKTIFLPLMMFFIKFFP